MSSPKEPCHFSDRAHWSQGTEKYLDLFSDVRDETVIGESSTPYTKAPRISGVAERIARFNPDSRFLYIVRDPIERVLSHYRFNWRVHGEVKSLRKAIEEEPDYTDFSNYAMQLTPYVNLFGLDRIKVLVLEEMAADASGVMKECYAWLGVDASFIFPDLDSRANETQPIQRRTRSMMRRLSQLRESHTWQRRVGPLVPKYVRSMAASMITESVDRVRLGSPREVEEVAGLLRPQMLEQTRALSEMLGRDFSRWRLLSGDSGRSLSVRP
jgi:hypothetical protein